MLAQPPMRVGQGVQDVRQQEDMQGSDAGAVTLGILLTLASQIFQAVRLIMEESLLKKMDLHPMEVSHRPSQMYTTPVSRTYSL